MSRIKGSIIDELRSMDWVPRSVRMRAREFERANAKLEHKLHRAPTDQELADELGVTSEELQEHIQQISNSESSRSTSCGRSSTPAAARCRCSTRSRTRTPPTRRR